MRAKNKVTELSIGAKKAIVMGPASSGGMVVAAGGMGVGEGQLACWNAADLTPRWLTENDGLWPKVIVDGLLVGGGPAGLGVRSIDSGRTLWHHEDFTGDGAFWNQKIVAIRGSRRNIDVLDVRSGVLLTSIRVEGEALDLVGRVCGERFLEGSRVVRCVNLAKGVPEWERDIAADLLGWPGVLPGFPGKQEPYIRYVAGSLPNTLVGYFSNATVAFSAVDGSILWVTPNLGGLGGVSVHDGKVSGRHGNEFWILDERTGAVLVRTQPPAWDGVFLHYENAALFFKNRVAIPFESGQLAIFNLENGDLVNLHVGRKALLRAVEAGGRLFVGTSSGKVLVFDEWIWGF